MTSLNSLTHLVNSIRKVVFVVGEEGFQINQFGW